MAAISYEQIFQYGKSRKTPKWPFSASDIVTESNCQSLYIQSGKCLMVILRIARQAGKGPDYEEDMGRRYYLWSDIINWLGDKANELYYSIEPKYFKPYQGDPDIVELRKELAEARSLNATLSNQLAGRETSAADNTLLDKNTILSIGMPYRNDSGIYFLIKEDRIVYVGQSVKVQKRIAQHSDDPLKTFDKVAIIPCDTINLLTMEAKYIRAFQPQLNSDNTKSLPLETIVNGISNASGGSDAYRELTTQDEL